MAFDSLEAFFAMGGHAPYVWSAWAMTAVLMLGAVIHARAERRRLIRDLQRRERRERRVESEMSRRQVNET
ncbi:MULTISPECIES: heme exporter protein CcmD [Halomonadaceae]|uniref:heme exporter protein CcmD n=1 Tax=Halomonadaceae TaxID=28256 RepID=UPI001599CE47|nr:MULTISPECIES: heme exporter protein CcmD [Halomonas]QJQ95170.1 heme exporter protein CcmD [Halomonas sp. PA5]